MWDVGCRSWRGDLSARVDIVASSHHRRGGREGGSLRESREDNDLQTHGRGRRRHAPGGSPVLLELDGGGGFGGEDDFVLGEEADFDGEGDGGLALGEVAAGAGLEGGADEEGFEVGAQDGEDGVGVGVGEAAEEGGGVDAGHVPVDEDDVGGGDLDAFVEMLGAFEEAGPAEVF